MIVVIIVIRLIYRDWGLEASHLLPHKDNL